MYVYEIDQIIRILPQTKLIKNINLPIYPVIQEFIKFVKKIFYCWEVILIQHFYTIDTNTYELYINITLNEDNLIVYGNFILDNLISYTPHIYGNDRRDYIEYANQNSYRLIKNNFIILINNLLECNSDNYLDIYIEYTNLTK